jgi:2-methylcitrate dehydratase PrpD
VSAVEKLIAYCCTQHRFDQATQDYAKHLLRDTLAVGIAGSTAPGALGVRATAQTFGAGHDTHILGVNLKLPSASAAFVNSFQIHCLEWDAVHEPAVVHALSVVTGVLISIAQRKRDITEDQFLSALIIGVDIAAGFGIASLSPLKFFRPATAGILGATLAAAILEKFTPAQMRDALGLAYSLVSGTMQAHIEGSIALPLQIAFAARGAITAIDLVKNNLTGPHDSIEGPYGYFKLIETESNLARYFDRLGQHWLINDVSIKPYPTGRAAHATLATLQTLQAENNFLLTDIKRIEANLTPLAYRLVGRAMQPSMTPAYARLCLRFLAALMLRDGAINPQLFTAETFTDPVICDLAEKIVPTSDDNPDVNALSPQHIRILFKNGETYERPIPHTLGHPAFPMTEQQELAKFNLCCALAENPLTELSKSILLNNPIHFILSGFTA